LADARSAPAGSSENVQLLDEHTPAAVLAVDDNPHNLRSLEAVLGELGANLVTAESGDEALLRVLERDFAVILLDIQMPGLDGFETARLIRARPKSRYTPIIFLTAFQYSETDVERGYALGAVDFLFKPMSVTVLKSKVSVFLELHRKTEAIRQQAVLLEDASKRENERRLAEAQARWEQDRLREEMDRERKLSEAMSQKAAELARTVAERKRAEEALRRTNQRLRLLADTASSLLLAPNADACFEQIGHGLTQHLGLDVWLAYAVDTKRGRMRLTSKAGVPEAKVPLLETISLSGDAVGRAAQEQQPVVAETADAVAAWGKPWDELGLAAAAAYPLVAHGHVLGALVLGARHRSSFAGGETAVMRTVADQIAMALERGKLIEQLQHRNQALHEADQRKDEFLAMLGHELRNPLAPVVNTLQLLQVKCGNDADLRNALEAANRQAQHMVRLLDDLLDVSRITRGKVELRRRRVDLASTIDDALQTTSGLVASKEHTLSVELPPTAVTIDVDATRFTQIVANLINNAARYTDPGGQIRVSCRVDEEDLVIVVRDNGRGIETSKLNLIFDTFVQVNPTSDRSHGGLGLGLTLVKRLTEMHGGSVIAKSEGPGRGCEFEARLPVVVRVPVKAPLPPLRERTANGEDDQLAPLRILLVEDNEDIRVTLRQLLELHGHEVQEASDGPRGLELIVGSEPQVAFVDIGLPGLDGYEVARQVRANQPMKQTRLVALSGYSGEDVKKKVLESGFDAHLVKPVGLSELRRVLSDIGVAP
jgi:signal transduction histidine kinase/DNA-binding response OmpR family regulator